LRESEHIQQLELSAGVFFSSGEYFRFENILGKMTIPDNP